MSSSDPESSLSRRLLSQFRWTDGHADFSAVLADGETLALLGPGLAAPFRQAGVAVVVGIEARGFVVGALVAAHLEVGLVLARKSGAVQPGPKVEVTSRPDWRGNEVVLQIVQVLSPAERVLVVDDLIETGSQALAIKEAVERCGAKLVGVSVLVDGTEAAVRDQLPLTAVARKAELGGPMD